MQWKVDKNDLHVGGSGTGGGGAGYGNGGGGEELRGEFRRASIVGPTSTADFGPAPMDEDDDGDDTWPSTTCTYVSLYCRVSRILAQEMSSDEEDEDEDEGWLF